MTSPIGHGTAGRLTHGWAVIDSDGAIEVRTVSDTRRAAMVNWLVVGKLQMIYSGTTDEEIERLWWKYRDGADVVIVSIATPPHPSGAG